MTRSLDRKPIPVPPEFGLATATLAARPAAKLHADHLPFTDLPITCSVALYEPPEVSIMHMADSATHDQFDEVVDDPDAENGVWALLGPDAVDSLSSSVGKGNISVGFAREGTRFRDALAEEYWTPEDAGVETDAEVEAEQ